MIIAIVASVILFILFSHFWRPGKQWPYVALLAVFFGLIFSVILSLGNAEFNHSISYTSENVALVPIAGNYYGVGHVDKDGSLKFTMLEGDTYETIVCENKHFSRTNAPKSDVYLEIRDINSYSSFLRLLFWDFFPNQYVLHAPQNAVLLDVPY